MSLVLITPPDPPLEELLLPALKANLRIDGTMEDPLLASLLGTARQYVEGPSGVQNRSLITQTWDWRLDAWPTWPKPLDVPLPPLQSVTSITVRDSAGAETVWPAAQYQVDVGDGVVPGRILPAAGSGWPAAGGGMNAITVRFVAGYGATLDRVPYTIRQALVGLAGQFYTNRDLDGPAPRWIEGLLAPFRLEV